MITLDRVLSWGPCWTEYDVRAAFRYRGTNSVTIREVLLDDSLAWWDRLWLWYRMVLEDRPGLIGVLLEELATRANRTYLPSMRFALLNRAVALELDSDWVLNRMLELAEST